MANSYPNVTRPALGADMTAPALSAPALFWARPLSDPFGGTSLAEKAAIKDYNLDDLSV